MRFITKLLLSIAIFCGGGLLASLIITAQGNQVSTGGIGPFIIYPAMIAGIWAVWKYNPEKKDDDNHRLNKN